MKLHDLQPAPGSTKTSKRIGRGHGSGKGKTAGKGMNGQKARSGPNPYRTFEGGQNRLVKRMPFKRGFTNRWRIEYQVLNTALLDEINGSEVTPEILYALRWVRDDKRPIKILGDGELSKALAVRAHKFSASARAKIEAAGGSVEELPWVVERHSRTRGPNPAMRNRTKPAE